MSEVTEVPVPGLDGTYRDTCVVCFRATDTAVALRGTAEWIMAGLYVLGIRDGSGERMVLDLARNQYGCDDGKVPVEDMTMAFRLCADCAAPAGMPIKPALLVGQAPALLPCYMQRGDDR